MCVYSGVGPRVDQPISRRPRKEVAENAQVLGNRRRPRRGGGQTSRPAPGGTAATTDGLDMKRNGNKRQMEKGLPELGRLNGIDGRGLGLKPVSDTRYAIPTEVHSQPNSARDRDEHAPPGVRKPPTHRGAVHDMQLAGQRLRDGSKRQADNGMRERHIRLNKPKAERDNTSITSNDDLLEASCDSVESESSSLAPRHARNQNKSVLSNLKLRIHGHHKVAH